MTHPADESAPRCGVRSNRLLLICTVAVVMAGIAFLALVAIGSSIGSGVRSVSSEALQHRPGDRVLALMEYVESDAHRLQDRNRAVWALGQLGDARALPVLEKYFTGGPCDHQRALCQRELEKAIRLCKGGFNLSGPFWRGSLDGTK